MVHRELSTTIICTVRQAYLSFLVISLLCFVCFNLSLFFLQEGRVSSDGVSGVGCILVFGLSSFPINNGMIKHVLHNIF